MVRKTIKQYYRCDSQSNVIVGKFTDDINIGLTSLSFNGLRNTDGSYTGVPAWFYQYVGFPATDTFWVMTPPSESGTEYTFSWIGEDTLGNEIEYLVTLTMLTYCEIDLGCDNSTETKPVSVLLFLTREGGWCYFPFKGKKSFEVKIPDAKTYISSNYVLRQTSRAGVYSGETLSTGDIPEKALDLLQALKESIQVYYVENYFDDGYQVYKPVIIQDGDFVKRKTGEKRWDVKVKFLYGEERIIQTQ